MKKILYILLLIVVCVVAVQLFRREAQEITTFTGAIEKVTPEGFIVTISPVEDYSDAVYNEQVTVVADENTKVYALGDGLEPWNLSGLINIANTNIADGSSSWIEVKTNDSIKNGAVIYAVEIVGL